jgi:hypothetical protein
VTSPALKNETFIDMGPLACGLWCNRYGQRAERLPGAPDRAVRSLAELPALVGAT